MVYLPSAGLANLDGEPVRCSPSGLLGAERTRRLARCGRGTGAVLPTLLSL